VKLAFVTNVKTQVESVTFEAGEPVVIGETAIPLDRFKSLLDARMVSVVALDSVTPSNPESVEAESEADLDDTPATEAPAEESPIVEPTQSSEPTPASVAAMEYPGLKERIALALINQGLVDAEALRKFVDEGKDLVDLDAIGKAAKAEILAWLEINLPSTTPEVTPEESGSVDTADADIDTDTELDDETTE
jgi:hypothetical protein